MIFPLHEVNIYSIASGALFFVPYSTNGDFQPQRIVIAYFQDHHWVVHSNPKYNITFTRTSVSMIILKVDEGDEGEYRLEQHDHNNVLLYRERTNLVFLHSRGMYTFITSYYDFCYVFKSKALAF